MRLIDADELLEHAYRDRLDSRERIAEMIKSAPTVPPMPKTKWIPADKLPPFMGNYEISDDALITNGYDVYMGYIVERNGKIFWHFYVSEEEISIEDEENDVIAWMPLPEAPKEIEWAEMTREESEGV